MISFNSVLRNPDSWCDGMDVDIMMENHDKLRGIMDRMFFSEYPSHPQYFALLFSKVDFADKLISFLYRARFDELDKIIFSEYGEDDKRLLMEKGFLNPIPVIFGLSAVHMAKSGEVCYVNLIV